MSGIRGTLALTCLMAAGALAADDAPVVFEEGLTYASASGVELKLNLARPKEGEGPFPLVLCIHGGGWRGGDRRAYNDFLRELGRRGFIGASISYRFAPQHPWPAQIEDVRAALAWLRGKARELKLDARRVAAIGHSAGGHLSLMLGLEADADKGQRRAIEAVVNYFGPTDLTLEVFTPEVETMLRDLAGGPRGEKAAVFEALSPLKRIGPADAPVLTFHGTTDALVPVDQARLLHRALAAGGIPHRLEILEGLGHGWGGEHAERTRERTVAFLEAYLKGSEHPLLVAEDFESGAERWRPTDAAAWKHVRDGESSYFSLITEKSAYQPKHRSPFNYAVLDDVVVEDFALDLELQYNSRDYGHSDLCLVFGYQDPEHFYYVHFGKEADAHANSIFIVNGAPRTSIAATRTDGTPWDRRWHRARIRRDAASGRIEVFFDDLEKPAMTAVDRNFAWGKIGIGSFDDKGNFDSIRLRGVRKR